MHVCVPNIDVFVYCIFCRKYTYTTAGMTKHPLDNQETVSVISPGLRAQAQNQVSLLLLGEYSHAFEKHHNFKTMLM